MKKLVLFFAAFVFVSCTSIDKNVELIPRPDYTENDALSDELSLVSELLKTDPVKALWRSYLAARNARENDSAQKLFEECSRSVSELCQKSYDSKDYVEALRCFRSLSSVNAVDGNALQVGEQKLYALALSNVPGLSAVNKKNAATVSDMIKGTVTVLVDKGIKIERGMGYSDSVLGSGFFISEDGYIVTNHHVISDMVDPRYEGFARLYIKLAEDPDTRIPAKVVGWDSTLDLALLKTEIKAPYVFELGSSSDLSVGDRVFAIGSPLGLDKTLTSGIISSDDRHLFSAGFVFQIDAAVNSGNSGGPLIDEKGRVQAVVFAGVMNYQGLNFAIPVEYLRYDLPFLFAGGERKHPWCGAYGKTKRLPGSGSVSEGVLVNYVMPGSSGDLSGLTEGATVVSVNGVLVSSLDDLHSCFMQESEETIVLLEVQNPIGGTTSFAVYLEGRPENPGYEIYRHDLISGSLLPILGMRLVGVSSSNKKKFSVVNVIKGSIADKAGFSENDPVDILNVKISDEKDIAYVEMYARKRKNGYLDVSLGLTASLDSPYYF